MSAATVPRLLRLGPAATEAHRVRALEAGADDVLARPFGTAAGVVRDDLLRQVRGALDAAVLDPKTEDGHIRWLRLKLKPDPAHPVLITTVRGRGCCCG